MSKFAETKNEFGIDLIRVTAMFFVVALHFFLYNGFYNLPVRETGAAYFVQLTLRTVFYQCVPLFLLITGYLKRKAVFGARHYVKALPVLVNYLIVSAITIIYKINVQHQELTFLQWAKSVWTFSQPSYAWYVEMYLCLFMLIPFINAGYNALKTRRRKFIAVLMIICLTTLSATVNRFRVSQEIGGVIGMPFGYFCGLWPVAYYCTGMYIGEFRPRFPRHVCLILAFALCLFTAFANFRTAPENYYSGMMFENGDIVNVAISAFIFLALYDIKTKKRCISHIFEKTAALSVSTYLFSSLFDSIFYGYYYGSFAGPASYPLMFLKIVPADFLCSLIAALPVYLFSDELSRLLMNFILDARKKTKKTV